jgi:FtsP/CotA-like multicopper oxidase with cupredoxin domain
MKPTLHRLAAVPIVLAAALLPALPAGAHSLIEGLTGTSFGLTIKADVITTGDGFNQYFWGCATPLARPQYPCPTLIVDQGATITVTVSNGLSGAGAPNVSLVFPGQVVSTGGGSADGLLTREAAPGATVTYTFTAANAGTYMYHSGTRPDLQIEMGLLGALIVRPYGFDPMAGRAYNHADSAYDHEYLFLLSEMDPRIHNALELMGFALGTAQVEAAGWLADYFPGYWFVNGRNAPDTMLMSGVPWLPTQPYGAMVRMRPGEKVLMRVIGGGRDMHPFHHHGNHAKVIARDARLLESAPGAGTDLAFDVFTVQSVPGETVDAIFTWTGKNMGWDIYGTGPDYAHTCTPNAEGFDPATYEWCADHGKAIPVDLPEKSDLTFGGFYSGSPFMGTLGALPPGEGGLNPNAGFTFMWHSHTEKEMTNFDIFPGGLMTMLVVEPPGTEIP